MTITKDDRTSDTVDFLPYQFDMPNTSSSDPAVIVESKSLHALENPTLTSPLKVEEPA